MKRFLTAAAVASGVVVLTASTAFAQDAQRGNQLFQQKGCWTCHATEGQGGRGPNIAPGPMAYAAFAAYVRMPALEMPPYSPVLVSDAELQDIHAYLESIPELLDPDDTILGNQ
ncbi:MAG: cytochrome c [Micropepsaceae bacterium]